MYKMKAILIKLFSRLDAILLLLLLVSCSSGNNKNNGIAESNVNEEEFSKSISAEGQNFKIPTPIELFAFMNENQSPFIKEALSNPSSNSEYLNQKSKALNLGIYMADLAYCSVFGNIQETIIYYSAAKLLAEDLGLNEGFGAEMTLRIDNNLNNIDSLSNIALESYDDIIMFLEQQGLAEVQGLIIAGGWIEGLYLSTKSIDGLDTNNPIMERIADQHLLLENLLDYLNQYSENSNVLEVITQLEELLEIYDQLYYNDENTPITKEQLISISNKVDELRSLIIVN